MLKRIGVICFIFCLFIILISLVNSFSSWNMPGYDLNRTNFHPGVGDIINPRILWEYDYPTATTNYYQSAVAVDDLNNDGIYEVCGAAKDYYIRCFNALNGTQVFAMSTGSYQPTPSASIITDLEDDGEKEIIHGTDDGIWFVFNGTDGSQRYNKTSGTDVSAAPTVYDFIGDSKKEILVNGIGGVFAYYFNGTQIWNNTNIIYSHSNYEMALADMNYDGIIDIITVANNNITILNISNGSFIKIINPPSTYPASSNLSLAGVSIVDFNNDSFPDMITSSMTGRLYGINNSGNPIWEYVANYYLQQRLSIGDIDSDGKPEVISSSYDKVITAINAEDGTILWQSFPSSISTGSSTIADIDNDGELEVLEVNSGGLNIYNGKYGYVESRVIVNTQSHSLFPSLADVDDDGFLEIFFGGRDYHNYYPPEYENKIVAIDNGGPSRPTSHKIKEVEKTDPLNWRIEGKNVIKNYDIHEYISSENVSSITNLTNMSTGINYSIISDDMDNDGYLEFIFTNGSTLYYIKSNSTIEWTYNSSKYITTSPLIEDYDDDGVDEILLLTNDTLFIFNRTGGQEMNYTHNTKDFNKEILLALDFDGDDNTEIFLSYFQYYSKSLLIENNKTVLFSDYSIGNTDTSPITDFDKDGILDRVHVTNYGQIRIVDGWNGRIIASQSINGWVTQSSILDINNDTYFDLVIGAQNHTKISCSTAYNFCNFSTYGGNNSGMYAFVYNTTSNGLSYLWNYSTENVTSKITVGDINLDNNNEIIFGDVSNKLYTLNSSGSHLWNLTLNGKIEYPSLIVNENNKKIIITTTNHSLYLINSSGKVLYNYNHSYKFGFSPIIVDIDRDSKGELVIGDSLGVIMVFDFNSSVNAILGNFIININNTKYTINEKGEGKIGNNSINIVQYAQSRVEFTINGTGNLTISLTNLTSNQNYQITNTYDGLQNTQIKTTNGSGYLTFETALGSLHNFVIVSYQYPTTTSNGGILKDTGCIFDFYVNVNSTIKGLVGGKIDIPLSIKNIGTCNLSDINIKLIFPKSWRYNEELFYLKYIEPKKEKEIKVQIEIPNYIEKGVYSSLLETKSSGKTKIKEFYIEVVKEKEEYKDENIIKPQGNIKKFNILFILICILIVLFIILYKKIKSSKHL